MKVFKFEVDEAFAKKNNEMLKDTKRLQLSAFLLAAILIAGAAALFLWVSGAWVPLVAGAMIVGAVISVILAFVVPRQVGTAQDLYDRYPLVPAVVAEVKERDFIIMALVNTNVDPDRPPRWGAAIRNVSRVNGLTPKLGAKLPAVAVQGRRSMGDQDHWDEISPMPIAWGTPDKEVVETARKAIPQDQWDKLERARKKLKDVKATRFNLLML